MATVNMLSRLLVIVGGLNWGLAVFGKNAVEMLLGGISNAPMVVYALVGIAALYEAYCWMTNCK
jgi:uncharacterized protein